MQRARQGLRAATTPAEAADQVIRYWDAREQLAEAKGQEAQQH